MKLEEKILVSIPGEPSEIANFVAKKVQYWLRQEKGMEIGLIPIEDDNGNKHITFDILRPEHIKNKSDVEKFVNSIGELAMKFYNEEFEGECDGV